MRVSESPAESRLDPRITVPRLYTLVRLRRTGEERYSHTGQILDIGLGGMCFSIDADLAPGETVEVRGMIPHSDLVTFRAVGSVLRRGESGVHAMRFDDFTTRRDEQRLADYITARRTPPTARYRLAA